MTTIEKLTQDIIDVGQVITNKLRTYEDIINAGVKITNALADLEQITDLKRAEICIRVENVGLPAAQIKVKWKNETIDERRLITIAKGYKNTLRSLEYRESR
jgi:hypothetical protein